MTETHTVKRSYYHFVGDDYDVVPNYESMTAYLIDMGIVHLSQIWDADNNEGTYLRINVNDYFVPAADSEDLPLEDIPKLFDMYRKDGYNGVTQYVADKRGIPNKRWRDN